MGAVLSAGTACAGSALATCGAYCACEVCKQCTAGLANVARLAYCFVFTLSLVLSWALRDYAYEILKALPWISKYGHVEPSHEWVGKQAVYRVSLGNFAFFGLLSLLLMGVKFKNEPRAKGLHTGGWFLKLCLWVCFNVIPFLLPSGFVNGYAWLARIGSGVFLVMQMLILLDFAHDWNDAWVRKESNKWVAGLLALTVTSYSLCIAGVALMYQWFKPAGAGKCGTNVALVTVTLVLAVVASVVSVLPAVERGSLFPSAIIALYTVYTCFSALASEPYEYECNGLGPRFESGNLAVGMALTLISVVYSALRAASSSASFSMAPTPATFAASDTPLMDAPQSLSIERDAETGGDGGVDDYDPVDYNYSFFHLVFALASMYVAMLMTSWASASEQERDVIDIGWTSVWVKTTSQWMMSLLYIWSLLAPVAFPDREFF